MSLDYSKEQYLFILSEDSRHLNTYKNDLLRANSVNTDDVIYISSAVPGSFLYPEIDESIVCKFLVFHKGKERLFYSGDIDYIKEIIETFSNNNTYNTHEILLYKITDSIFSIWNRNS